MPFKFRIESSGDAATAFFEGALDETARDVLFELKGKLANARTVTFDLARVGRLNSVGIAAWINFLRAFPEEAVEFVHCSIVFMDFATMVPQVANLTRVRSFHAPFLCEACDAETTKLLPATAAPGPVACPTCGGEAKPTGFLVDMGWG